MNPIGTLSPAQNLSIPKFFPALPDESPSLGSSGDPSFGALVQHALGETAAALERADTAERAFAHRRGGLQAMVLERAQADVVLSLASAAATRTSQALTTILGMQI